MQKLFIPVILGTAREGRRSQRAAKFVFDLISKRDDIETQFVDVRDFLFGCTIDENGTSRLKPWEDIATRSHGFVIVSPEYNHSFPGELKIMLDSLLEEYNRKPVGVCGVSKGAFGGVRMIDHLKPVLVELKLVPIRRAVQFTNIETLFDEDGMITASGYEERVNGMLDELVEFARALQI